MINFIAEIIKKWQDMSFQNEFQKVLQINFTYHFTIFIVN